MAGASNNPIVGINLASLAESGATPSPLMTPVEANSLGKLKQRVRRQNGAFRATPREREILGLLAVGLTDKEAAVQLGISPRTVQMHLRHFCKRNAVRNRAEAAALWTGSHCDRVVSKLVDEARRVHRIDESHANASTVLRSPGFGAKRTEPSPKTVN